MVRTAQLRAAGVSSSAIEVRCRPGGPWQRLLPGVLLLGNGTPTRRQQVQAALAYAGRGAVVTGVDSLREQGLTHLPLPDQVHVLLPATRKVTGREFVHIERTTRLPPPVYRCGLPLAPPARATLDAARRQPDPVLLHSLLGEVVRHGACTVADLTAELDAGSRRGTAAARNALHWLTDRARAITDAWARAVVNACPLPKPRWHVPVNDPAGTPLGTADAWWGEVALAWQIGSRSQLAIDRRRADRTDRALAAAGVTVLRTPVSRLHADPGGVRRELTRSFHQAATRRAAEPMVVTS
ncbi:hypothetical protein F0L68_11325 [Solihabitans fulvus]|uniref:Transcriptional regulator, AbiEi antitoxin, Type IV TA system n=1 Tax=Solihabitans fulvus TaxID=1892852 RepID=A0A5B2XJ66_9PSEU|nr:hypothetical protein F0L68_11325 [Solihabitans fulvus]